MTKVKQTAFHSALPTSSGVSAKHGGAITHCITA